MRTMSRRIDSVIALGIGFALLAATSIFGDPIYAGIRYYLIAWFGLVGLAQIAKAPPLFTTGAAAALAASFLFYWAWQASLPQPEGLLGLGHLFSLPGLGIAAVIAAVIARRRQMLPWAAHAHPSAPANDTLSAWAAFAVSGAKTSKSFESQSTYISVRTSGMAIISEASRRHPPPEIYVGQSTSITCDPSDLGNIVKTLVKTLRLLDSQGAL